MGSVVETVTAKVCIFFWNSKTFANKPLQNSCSLAKITHQLCKSCPFTVNHFRRFSVAANRIFCWLSCRTSDYNTSNNIDSCAKRSILDPLSVVFSCYLRCIAAKTFYYLKNLFINSLFSFIFCTFAVYSWKRLWIIISIWKKLK